MVKLMFWWIQMSLAYEAIISHGRLEEWIEMNLFIADNYKQET